MSRKKMAGEIKLFQSHTPTPATLAMVRAAGFAQIRPEMLLPQLKISRNTFDKYYGETLKMGRLEAIRAVNNKFLEKALDGDTQCLLHATKTIGGLSEKVEHDIKADININLSWLSNRNVIGSKPGEIIDCDQAEEVEYQSTPVDNGSTADMQADYISAGNLHTPTVEIKVGKRIVKRRTPAEIKRVKGVSATWSAKAEKAKAEKEASMLAVASEVAVPKKQATGKRSSTAGVGVVRPGEGVVDSLSAPPIKNSKF